MIFTSTFETELGTMIAGATEDGVCLLEFLDRHSLKSELDDLKKYLGNEVIEQENDQLAAVRIQLDEYFEGKRKSFELNLITPGTDFQQRVWKELLNIPYGTTRTYQQQSEALGNKLAIRAVAGANGMNRIAIVIPCHRVIGSDGSLTGYGGGVKRKKWLLDHERLHSGKNVDLTLF